MVKWIAVVLMVLVASVACGQEEPIVMNVGDTLELTATAEGPRDGYQVMAEWSWDADVFEATQDADGAVVELEAIAPRGNTVVELESAEVTWTDPEDNELDVDVEEIHQIDPPSVRPEPVDIRVRGKRVGQQ